MSGRPLPLIHLYTHDSIGVGEDGPTHQPIEHLASIRAMPGVIDLRPGANEVAEAWRVLMPIRHEPVALMLSRQPLPTLDRARYTSAAGVARGAYVLADPPEGEPEVILIATGSELGMTVDAYERLTGDGIRARVVSMPSMELFDKQPRAYRDEVLPPSITARVSVEKGSTFGWDRWVGLTGAIIGMSTFGASAPLKVLQAKFGFTVDHIVAAARNQLGLEDDTTPPASPSKPPKPPKPKRRDRAGPASAPGPQLGAAPSPAALAAGGWARRVIKRAATGLRSTRWATVIAAVTSGHRRRSAWAKVSLNRPMSSKVRPISCAR